MGEAENFLTLKAGIHTYFKGQSLPLLDIISQEHLVSQTTKRFTMGVTYHNGISILQLIVYLPVFFLSAFLVFRHSLRRSSGFFFLNVFAQARIVGTCCDLATIDNQTAIGLYVASAVCSSIGLSPLLLACAGLLSRA
jgi:hypothetical protein